MSLKQKQYDCLLKFLTDDNFHCFLFHIFAIHNMFWKCAIQKM